MDLKKSLKIVWQNAEGEKRDVEFDKIMPLSGDSVLYVKFKDGFKFDNADGRGFTYHIPADELTRVCEAFAKAGNTFLISKEAIESDNASYAQAAQKVPVKFYQGMAVVIA